MDQVITWIIIAAFYAPLHFAGPVGVAILITPSAENRQRLVRYMLIDCTLSMLVAFALVISLVTSNLGVAMAILLISMLVPYLLLFVHRQLLNTTAS